MWNMGAIAIVTVVPDRPVPAVARLMAFHCMLA